MLPNFLVIGAPKCGTSSLCHLLGQHPQIFMSKVKEPHFFGRNDPLKTLKWYKNHFRGSEGFKAVGEGSTSYTHPHIIKKAAFSISEMLPKCRLIYIVRNPIKRLESDWKMRKREGWAQGSLSETVNAQETLVSHGMYFKNITVYRKLFNDSQILILFLEDFSINPMIELKKCFKHLGVDDSIKIKNPEKPLNVSAQFRKDGFTASIVRKTPMFIYLKKVMPLRILNVARLFLTNKYDFEVKWEPEVKSSVIEQIINDSNNFLDYCGKPKDFWVLHE
jgi:hypothetical protein